MSKVELLTTSRRKERNTKAAKTNRELLEALNMPDEILAGNLGMTGRNIQRFLAGAKLREDTLLLLHILNTYKIDLRTLREELGLNVY